ncbi:hypothetical protein SAMN05216249_10350 [Acetitomaculum ruminis DSM 5522]|uniref:MacB-like core domain-containing protein n=1 Tax=Acetitomaculum ruminis DSM 5522 TaxID=1120918 RepID=A0A1I0W4D0_9FIRM|nr:ABC transporter permease [Acetitomaculum ruminis]SFA83080.1 hypothetical protein SAMN05216249_10350 [Acetitomaculum ruminis DSM 5522]
MKMIHWEHIIEIGLKNAVMFSMLLILITINFSLTGNIAKKNEESQKVENNYKSTYGETTFYWMTEALKDQEYYNYMEGDSNGSSYKKMTDLLNELWNEKSFQFYTCNNQTLILKGKMKDIFLEGYEDGDFSDAVKTENGKDISMVKSVQVSSGFFDCNNIQINSGRAFSKEDYLYTEGKTIPVIMGKAYKDYYKIGDILDANFIMEDMKMEVVGFLEDKSFFLSYFENDFVSLERYILIPAWNFSDKSEFSKMATLTQLNGNIKANQGYEELSEQINNIVKKYNSKWQMNIEDPNSDSGTNVVKKYQKMTSQVSNQFNILVILIMIFIVISLVINIFSILEKYKYNFSVELLCGAGFWDIYKESMGFTISLILLGNLGSTLYLFINDSGKNSIILVDILSIVIVAIMAVASYIHIKRMNLGDIIGGEE